MRRTRLHIPIGAATALAVLLIAGCGTDAHLECKDGTMTMPGGRVMCASAMSAGSSGTTDGSKGKRTMKIGSGGSFSTRVPKVNGQQPIPTQVLASADWQGMRIQVQTMTPIRFVVFNGASEQIVHPPKHASFHLMIMLSDKHTGEPIPYASSVWATITDSHGRVVFNDTQWPMISAYMGPHYGNDVPHLASGRYRLKILIGPPAFARAGEYRNVWLKPHKLTMRFAWNAATGAATVIGGSSSGTAGSSASMSDMAGMGGMGGGTAHAKVSVNGVRATPSRLIATAYWQGMRIQTRTAAATRLYTDAGGSTKSIDPAAGSSFHMIVTLDDRRTDEPVTYAPVYATIKSAGGTVVYHGRLEPTISAFDGPYYGSDVSVPGRGRYTLALRIEPPRQARHLEYEHVWLHPHTVVEHFTWNASAVSHS